jgi:serine/threonine protein kinase
MDRGTFLNELRQSGLLSGQAIGDAVARFPDHAQGRAMTRVLVAAGHLTRFQATKLLAGKGKALRLGPYQILDPIGRGATGSVFKARHKRMGRVVAIKIVHPHILRDNAALNLFQREVHAVAHLHHPGIATAYDAGVSRGRHFLVMEYVDGPSLQSLVETHGPLPFGLACELMRQAADTLQYAHENGMVHRDIKPANLLIAQMAEKGSGVISLGPRTSDRKSEAIPDAFAPLLKIIDFGLARLRQTGRAGVDVTIQVAPGTVWGTVDYIAPEQAQNIHDADIRADLYSLGCTFYFALTGEVPFTGRSELEKLIKHQLHQAPPLAGLRPDTPIALTAIIERLMAKDRTKRFETPAELAQELAGVCDTRVSGIRAPDRQAPDFMKQPSGGATEAGSRQTLPDPTGQSPSTVDEVLRTKESAPPMDDALLENWRLWTAIVELFARGRSGRRRVTRQSYDALRQQLLQQCAAEASTAEGLRHEFFLKLAEIVKPWLSPDTFLRTEPELLYSLLGHCQQAEQGLLAMIESQDTSGAGQTLLGKILDLFKRP